MAGCDEQQRRGDDIVELGANGYQEIRNSVPVRRDVCQLLLSGVIGNDPKEAYLSNGHYVVNFALTVIGHFEHIHEWEKYKVNLDLYVMLQHAFCVFYVLFFIHLWKCIVSPRKRCGSMLKYGTTRQRVRS